MRPMDQVGTGGFVDLFNKLYALNVMSIYFMYTIQLLVN